MFEIPLTRTISDAHEDALQVSSRLIPTPKDYILPFLQNFYNAHMTD